MRSAACNALCSKKMQTDGVSTGHLAVRANQIERQCRGKAGYKHDCYHSRCTPLQPLPLAPGSYLQDVEPLRGKKRLLWEVQPLCVKYQHKISIMRLQYEGAGQPAARGHLMSGVKSPVSSTSFLPNRRHKPLPQSSTRSRTRACTTRWYFV